ncbi:Cytochrome c oxidase subunit 8A, mitochondrial [Myotis davidii]|uniref:Cytochrome c oxidase subunit 8 n=1 Tax=Myotis davidii TaxID=225400 RepID=L5M5Z9_MYODS|nr:Cytochrome c oxidase subunit 8A, mitochondrial [Myotis davidii]
MLMGLTGLAKTTDATCQVHFKPPREQLGTVIIVTGLPSCFLCIFLLAGWVFSHLESYKKLEGKGLSSVSAVTSRPCPVLIVFAALRAKSAFIVSFCYSDLFGSHDLLILHCGLLGTHVSS